LRGVWQAPQPLEHTLSRDRNTSESTLAAKLALALPLLKPISTAAVQLDILPLLAGR